MRSSKYILYYDAVQSAGVCSESTMTNRTICSRYCGLLLREAAQRASNQKLHGVVSRKYMESYLQYNVQSVFSFGLDSAVQLYAVALHSRPRGRTQKGLWAPNQQRSGILPAVITHAAAPISKSYQACRCTSYAI